MLFLFNEQIMENQYNSIEIVKNPAHTLLCETFSKINKALEKFNSSNLEEKYVLNTKIKGLIQSLYILTVPFWEEMGWMKDILSYRFNQRIFPENTNQDWFHHNLEKNPVDPEKILLRKNMILKIKAKYGTLEDKSHLLEETAYVNEAGNFLYRPLTPNKYYEYLRQDQINYIFSNMNKLDLSSRINLFQCLICSREFCHLAFNSEILNIFYKYEINDSNITSLSKSDETKSCNDFIKKNNDLYYYLFYGLYLLYKEECQICIKSDFRHRHILDLEAISKIPAFDGKLSQNPFIPLSLSKEHLENQKINPNLIVLKRIKGAKCRGLYSIYSSWKRFDIFTDGIFRNLKCDKIYFSGSIVMACLVRNPLELLFGINIPREKDLIYDPVLSSDDPTYLNYLARITKLWNEWDLIQNNLNDYFDEYFPSKRVLPPFEIGKDISNLNFLELEDKLSDIDIMVDVKSDIEFNNITLQIFDTIKQNLKRVHNLKQLTDQQIQLIEVQSNKSYKYYISGTLLNRSVEIFRFYNYHPFGGISKYHFPAVRAMYCPQYNLNELLFGKIFVFPSFWSYAQTGCLIDYKWLAFGSHPLELVIKYYLRGAYPILNENEQKAIYEFINNSSKWKFIMDYKDHGEFTSINNPIFKPRKYGLSNYKEIKKYLNYLPKKNDYNYIPEENDKQMNISTLRWTSGHLRFSTN